MGDIPYWPPEKVTIETKDEICTEKVLKDIKVIKEQSDDNTIHIIDNMNTKHESVMNTLKLISIALTISMTINIFLLIVLCYLLGVFG